MVGCGWWMYLVSFSSLSFFRATCVRNKCYWRVAGIGRPLINDFRPTLCPLCPLNTQYTYYLLPQTCNIKASSLSLLVRSYGFSHSLETIVRIQPSMLLWCNKFSFLDAKMMGWAISLKIKYGVFSNSWLSNSNAPLVQMVPHKVLEKNETLYLSPTFLKSPALTLVEIRSFCASSKNISPPN